MWPGTVRVYVCVRARLSATATHPMQNKMRARRNAMHHPTASACLRPGKLLPLKYMLALVG